MSEISSAHSSDYLDGSKDLDDILSNPLDLTPRSTARRTTRNRIPRSTPAGISDSDFSENDESPRKARTGGRVGKRHAKHGHVLRDESGRPLSPAEARRQRKRITNRESARRMRLLRKEEWNNLQQEVHNKTMELQKVHAMNRRMNEGFATLELRCRNLHNHNQAMMSEVLNLVDHLRDNLGKELDNKRLAGFLRGVSALMPPQQPLHQGAGSDSAAAAGGDWVMSPDHPKPSTFSEGKLASPAPQIHITANGTAASFDSLHMGRSASAPEPRHDFMLATTPVDSLGCDSPTASLSPHPRVSGPLHPSTPTVAVKRELLPQPLDDGKVQVLRSSLLHDAAACPVTSDGLALDLGRFPSVDEHHICAAIGGIGSGNGLDTQLSIGGLLAMDFC